MSGEDTPPGPGTMIGLTLLVAFTATITGLAVADDDAAWSAVFGALTVSCLVMLILAALALKDSQR